MTEYFHKFQIIHRVIDEVLKINPDVEEAIAILKQITIFAKEAGTAVQRSMEHQGTIVKSLADKGWENHCNKITNTLSRWYPGLPDKF